MAQAAAEAEAAGTAAAAEGSDDSPVFVKKTAFKLPSDSIDVSKQAFWFVSGSKSGHGVDKLMDDDSDGLAPHTLTFQFSKRTALSKIAFCVNYSEDESYTPEEISISCGTMKNNVEEIMNFTVTQPSGWVHVPLGDSSKEGQNAYLRTFVLRLTVKKMHQSGRDTRLRLLRLVAPRPVAGATGAGAPLPSAAASFQMSSTRMHTMR